MQLPPLIQVFDCIRCGRVSTLTEPPLRCRACGGGTGIIRPLESRDNNDLLHATVPSSTTALPPGQTEPQ